MDDPDTIIRKFKRAVTDSEACVRYCDEQPGIKNLIDIYCAVHRQGHRRTIEQRV